MECSVDECTGQHYCKGYCRMHYVRWRRHGDPLITKKPGRESQGPCRIEGCGGRRVGQGLCDKHYRRMQRYGNPLATKRIIGDDEARWWSYVDRRADDECWPWKGSIDDQGYGRFGPKPAHTWGYKRFAGPVPPGWQVDHVKANGCTLRHCVNFLRHLEPVTSRENCLRGERTKLSDEQVADLLARIQAGERFANVAQEAGVHKGTLARRIGMLAISRAEQSR